MPAVSVVMAVRDGEAFVAEAVDSVLGQEFGDFEFLIVDDGSTDATAAILARYDDPRVRVLSNPSNLGLTRSLCLALAESTGRYIARQDADDRSLPGRLQRQVSVLERSPRVGLVGCEVRWIDESGRGIGGFAPPTTDEELQAGLWYGNVIAHGSVMLRREAVERAGGYRASYPVAQDYDLWLRLSEGWELVCVPEPLYEVRRHAGAITARRNPAQREATRRARAAALRRRVWLPLRALPGTARSADERRRLARRFRAWSDGALEARHRLASLLFAAAALAYAPADPEHRAGAARLAVRAARMPVAWLRRRSGPGDANPEI